MYRNGLPIKGLPDILAANNAQGGMASSIYQAQ